MFEIAAIGIIALLIQRSLHNRKIREMLDSAGR